MDEILLRIMKFDTQEVPEPVAPTGEENFWTLGVGGSATFGYHQAAAMVDKNRSMKASGSSTVSPASAENSRNSGVGGGAT